MFSMGLFPKLRKISSDEFAFLMNKIESFEVSTKEMSKSLEKILGSLSEILARQDERLKVTEEKQDALENKVVEAHRETFKVRMLLASIAGGLAVLTFIAAESKIVEKLFNGAPVLNHLEQRRTDDPNLFAK